MIDRLSDLIADRCIAEIGHKRDKSMSLGIKISKSKKKKNIKVNTVIQRYPQGSSNGKAGRGA